MNPTELKPLLRALSTIKGIIVAPNIHGEEAVKLLADQHEVLSGASGRNVAQAFEHWMRGGQHSLPPPPPARDTGELSKRPNHLLRPKD